MSAQVACPTIDTKDLKVVLVKKICFQKPKPCPEWECNPCPPCETPCENPWSNLTDCDETSKAWLVTCDENQNTFRVVG